MQNQPATNTIIRVIIPAYNEESSIGKVINDIPKEWVSEVIVVNNASSDNTKEVAAAAGATVLTEITPGYGNACLKGIDYLKNISNTDIVVFLDGHDVHRFLQVVVCALLHGVDGGLDRAESCDHQNGDSRIDFARLPQYLETIEPRHPQIGDQEIRALGTQVLDTLLPRASRRSCSGASSAPGGRG